MIFHATASKTERFFFWSLQRLSTLGCFKSEPSKSSIKEKGFFKGYFFGAASFKREKEKESFFG